MEKLKSKADPQKWLEQYGDLLYQYALPRVNDTSIAEDLVQDTFLSALKGLENYKGEASEKNWLFAILKNKIIDHYRKRSTEQAVLAIPDMHIMDDHWFNEEGGWVESRMPNDWQPASSLVERKEIQQIIAGCKDHLKTMQKNVFILKYMEDMNSGDICKVLNITPSNYWILIHRARLQMRECVEKKWLKT